MTTPTTPGHATVIAPRDGARPLDQVPDMVRRSLRLCEVCDDAIGAAWRARRVRLPDDVAPVLNPPRKVVW
jgi:hypothetical protein